MPLTREDLRAVRELVHEENKAAHSLKKNGDTLQEWLGKVITIDRIILIVVLGFQLGGKTAVITNDTERAVKTAAAATKQTEALSSQVQMLSDFVVESAANRSAELKATRNEVAALEDRLRVTVTRKELHDTVQRELLPRLVRIEQKVGP